MPIRLVASACLALWLAPCLTYAQDTAPPTPPLLAAPSSAIIDPAARTLFLQMVTAQKGLHSFVVAVSTQDQSAGNVVPDSKGQLRISYSAPARASVTLSQEGKTLGRVVSSGILLSRVDMRSKSYRQNVLSSADAEGTVINEIGDLGPLPRAFIDPGGLPSLLTASGLVAVARGTVAGPVDGVPVDSIVARLIGTDMSELVYTFVIGRNDHLLREVSREATLPQAKVTPASSQIHTETVTELLVNPVLPASTFAFKPAAGFKKVTSAP